MKKNLQILLFFYFTHNKHKSGAQLWPFSVSCPDVDINSTPGTAIRLGRWMQHIFSSNFCKYMEFEMLVKMEGWDRCINQYYGIT
jgi:hypothetical protein